MPQHNDSPEESDHGLKVGDRVNWKSDIGHEASGEVVKVPPFTETYGGKEHKTTDAVKIQVNPGSSLPIFQNIKLDKLV